MELSEGYIYISQSNCTGSENVLIFLTGTKNITREHFSYKILELIYAK